MKVLMINGSPHKEGNTYIALKEMEKIFSGEGIESEIIQVGHKPIRGCIGCRVCAEKGYCVFDDCVNEIAPKFEACDGLVIGSPVYYASANGTMISFLDRLFFSTPFDKTMKVGASVAVARRGGLSATFDELNKYFTISGMPVASGQYWNSVHGREIGEAAQDAEGLQGMRTLARNMAFLMRSIELGREKYGLPEKEPFERMNFIRLPILFLSGMITGSFMSKNSVYPVSQEYGRIHSEYHADAWLYGTVTTKEFTGYRKPLPDNTVISIPDEDFVTEPKTGFYYVSVDTLGEIGRESGTFKKAGNGVRLVYTVCNSITML